MIQSQNINYEWTLKIQSNRLMSIYCLLLINLHTTPNWEVEFAAFSLQWMSLAVDQISLIQTRTRLNIIQKCVKIRSFRSRWNLYYRGLHGGCVDYGERLICCNIASALPTSYCFTTHNSQRLLNSIYVLKVPRSWR